jgi:hypothetical protein
VYHPSARNLVGLTPPRGLRLARALDRVAIGPLAAGIAIALLAGCASLPGEQMADTAQGQIEISEIRKAEPVVVFESSIG